MKKQLIALVFLLVAFSGSAQFVQQPLNYPGVGYWPYYISIVDPEHVWIGTFREFELPYSSAVKTIDGGNSWIFNSIPVPGAPFCTSAAAWDALTCFYVFTDIGNGGGTIWKTTDGGNNWTNMVTTQFTGGFANFYHPFTAETGVAMGDPTNGYFEIQITGNGGVTWDRVPSANIPLPLSGEYGLTDGYSAAGNSIWFATNKGRCYRSADRGQHWDVTPVITAVNQGFDVCFSTELNGVFWKNDAISSDIAVTRDGGISWETITFPSGYQLRCMSRVEGFEEGFVVTAFKNLMDVYFTPDMFASLQQIGTSLLSNGAVSFLNATTGWLGGGESGSNEIFRYTGILTSARGGPELPEKSPIVPNPSAVAALVRLPAITGLHSIRIRITDITGKVLDQYPVASNTGWATLNARAYKNGLYLVEIFSEKNMVAREKWVVSH